jgi:hypothetical protein
MSIHPYATLEYARTLAHVGRPLWVPAWQTHVIVRDWNSEAKDAMGPYPLTFITPGADLGAGTAFLREAGLVSVTLVLDGSGPPVECELVRTFSPVRPFKTHYLVDTAHAEYAPSAHHRYEIERAARRGVEVREAHLAELMDGWITLYDELIGRHAIRGVQRFSRSSFEDLARCPGLTTVAAFLGDELVACHLWFLHDDLVWSHLAAANSLGYSAGAAYAVYDHSIRAFAPRTINLGGSAGTGGTEGDGLARFKSGFANRTGTSLLCGAILDGPTYDALARTRGSPDTDYFPSYRV